MSDPGRPARVRVTPERMAEIMAEVGGMRDLASLAQAKRADTSDAL